MRPGGDSWPAAETKQGEEEEEEERLGGGATSYVAATPLWLCGRVVLAVSGVLALASVLVFTSVFVFTSVWGRGLLAGFFSIVGGTGVSNALTGLAGHGRGAANAVAGGVTH